MGFDPAFFVSLLPAILWASLMTVAATLAGYAGAVLVGLVLALGRRTGRVGWVACVGFTEFVRLSPFLVQLYFLYFVLPVWGIVLGALTVGVLTLSLHFGAFLGEIFSAGLDAVAPGQIEAARALGLRRTVILWRVVLPQTVRFVAGPSANTAIALLKTTPYLAVVGVPEMLGMAFDKASDTFRYVEPLTAAGVLFLAYSASVSAMVRWMERRFRVV